MSLLWHIHKQSSMSGLFWLFHKKKRTRANKYPIWKFWSTLGEINFLGSLDGNDSRVCFFLQPPIVVNIHCRHEKSKIKAVHNWNCHKKRQNDDSLLFFSINSMPFFVISSICSGNIGNLVRVFVLDSRPGRALLLAHMCAARHSKSALQLYFFARHQKTH